MSRLPLPNLLAARLLIVLLSLGALAGCTRLQVTSKPLLKEARLAQGSVVLDLFFVRLPHNASSDELWRELDEQIVAPTVRQRLLAHGFRVGKSALHPPALLEKLLNEQPATAPPEEGVVTQLEFDPIVSRRHLQLPTGGRAHVETSRTYATLSLLESPRPGEVSGLTLSQAQCLFIAQALPSPDGRVRLKLLPEIHHGEFKSRVTPLGQSHFKLEPERQRKTFDELLLEAPLAPGEMLIIGAQANRPGSAGHYFFSEKTSTGLVRKLLVVRVSQTQYDPALAPAVNLAAQGNHELSLP